MSWPRSCMVWMRAFHTRWVRHDLTDSAAALAFYGLVSLAPLLLLGVGVAGLLLGERAAHGELAGRLTDVMGAESAEYVEGVLQGAKLGGQGSPWVTAVSVLVLAYAGTHVLHKLRSTLNTINEVEAGDPGRRWWGRLLARGMSGLFILLPGLLLVVGTVAKGFAGHFARQWDVSLLEKWQLWRWYDRISTCGLLVVAFTFIMKVLPRRRPRLAHAFAGGSLAAVAVCLLKGGLDFYLAHSFLGTVFGTGLAVLVFLLWFLLSVESFLAGAQVAAMFGEGSGGQARGTGEGGGR